MQIVPIVPQQKIAVEENLEVSGIAAVKLARAVADKTMSPLRGYVNVQQAYDSSEINRAVEKQFTEQRGEKLNEMRRLVCRRIQHQHILEELRSVVDRRRHTRRRTDLQLHIDEQV